MQIPNLRLWRELRGLTQQELADRAGLHLRSVYGYEAGEATRPNTARKLADALDVEIIDLVGDEAIPKEPGRHARPRASDQAERTLATIEQAARRLLATVEPVEAKLAAGSFTDEDRRNLDRAAALITPLLQMAIETEARYLRERHPGVYDVGPYAVLGPVVVRFLQVILDADAEAEELVRDLDRQRRTAYLAAA